MGNNAGKWLMIFVLAAGGIFAYRYYVNQAAPGGSGGPRVSGGTAAPMIGRLAPEIEGEDVDKNAFKLSDYRGKVVALDFWGFW